MEILVDMRSEMIRKFNWLACCLVLFAATLFGQQDQGVITGVITDESRAVIPGAIVTAREVNTNISTKAATNGNGVFHIGPVRTGSYEVSVEARQFRTAVRHSVDVHPNDRIGLNFTLRLGSATDVIVVTGRTPLLRTENSSLERNISRQEIQQMPLVDRNYQILAKLSAGVLPEIDGRDLGPLQRGGQSASGFVSHGQPALQNNYLIDGIDNNSTVMGLQDRKAQAVVPSLDAIQEFTVLTSNYDAEFGRNAGAVVNVTVRSGTNSLHGSAYNHLRNDIFDARPTFSYTDRDGDGKADPAVLRQNMFGATAGGPMKRDQGFFFVSWESWRVRLAQSDRSTIPTALERHGNFSQTEGLKSLKDPLGGNFPNKTIPASRLDPAAVTLMELYPVPNYTDVTRTNYLSNPPWRTDRDQFDTRIDYRISDRDTVFGRYSWYNYDSLRAGSLPGLARGAHGNERALDDNDGRHLTLSHTRVVRANIVNQLRFGYKSLKVNKRNDDAASPAGEESNGLTRYTLGGKLDFRGLGGGQPVTKHTDTFQLLDNLTWIRGNHAVKLGTDIRYDRSAIDSAWKSPGLYGFNGQFSSISLGDMLLGWSNSATLSTPIVSDNRFRSWMFYVQDDWKLSPTFTLNVGLRYELTTPWFENNNHASRIDLNPSSPAFGQITYGGGDSYAERSLIEMDTNNWAPRAGFAWRPAQKWTVRAAAGIFYGGEMALGSGDRSMQNHPFASSATKRATKTKPALVLADGFPEDFLADLSLVYEVDDLPPNSDYRTWDSNLPHPQTYQWNCSIQRELTRSMVLKMAYVGSGTRNIAYIYDANAAGIGDPETEKQRRLLANLTGLAFRSALAHSTFHGLDIDLEKRFASGFAFTAAYTWGHNIGQRPDQFVDGDNVSPQDIRCISCEKGSSSSDVRHRIVSSYIFELPFGRGRRWLSRSGAIHHLLGGWQISGWISAQTGMYFNPELSNASSCLGTGGVGIWRADLVGNWQLDNPTTERWFNPEAFLPPCDPDGTNCRFGNAGRNNLQEPGMFNWTAALGKRFDLTERILLNFRWEVLNILNHPNYGTPNRTLDSPDVGTIRSTHNHPRQMQFSLRLSF